MPGIGRPPRPAAAVSGSAFAVNNLVAEIAGVDVGRKVDTELLQKLALHFGHDDAKHHLLFALDTEKVHDLVLLRECPDPARQR